MKHKFLYFLVLFLILGFGTWLFYQLQGQILAQFIVGCVTTLTYIAWGILYHLLEEDLHWKIVVEYLLVGAIAMVVLATVLWT